MLGYSNEIILLFIKVNDYILNFSQFNKLKYYSMA